MPAEKPTSGSVGRWDTHSQPVLRKIRKNSAVTSTAAPWYARVITIVRRVPSLHSANPVTTANAPATPR